MKLFKTTICAASIALLPLSVSTVMAQDGATSLEEIVVTGRKREESLIEVPVAISTLNANDLAERGILSQQALFDAIPSLTYDVNNAGRSGANPGVRGVQSELIASNQQRVNSFIDGIPMAGNSGTLQFSGIDAVEVYRGPQSAAFGRSTFVGAINYVTANADDEFSGDVRVGTSEHGNNEIGIALTGPLTDWLGYRISYLEGDNEGPDEWTATDGTRMGSEETQQITAKFNFDVTDSIYGEIMYSRLDTFDVASAAFVLDPANCVGDSGIGVTSMMATVELLSGAFDCDASPPAGGIPNEHDVLGQFITAYDEALFTTAATVAAGPAAGTVTGDLDGDGVLSVTEWLAQDLNGATYEQHLLVNTIPNPGADALRDRFQGELSFEIGDGLLQVLGMYSDEESFSWSGNNYSDTQAAITTPTTGPPPLRVTSLSNNLMNMVVDSKIEEKYLEARWISPDDQRLRYTASATYYNYDLLARVYNNGGAIFYGLEDIIDPNEGITNSEVATNTGFAFSVQYDITDRTTLSLESSFQSDENCGFLQSTGEEFCRTTDAILPRVAVTSQLTENHNVYAQFSVGNNPAGVNVGYADPTVQQSIRYAAGIDAIPEFDDDGNPVAGFGRIYDGTDPNYNSETSITPANFLFFDEETLNNFEIGAKGTFLDGRASYAAAIYYMEWKDMINAINLNWDDTTAEDLLTDPLVPIYGGWNEGDWNDDTSYRSWVNAGDAEYYGIEATADFLVNDYLTVGGYLTLSKAEFTDSCSIDADTYFDLTVTPNTTLYPVLTPAVDGVLDNCSVVNGNTIPRQSEVTANLNFNLTAPETLLGFNTSVRLDIQHEGENFDDDANLITMPAVTTANMSVNMNNDNWRVRLFINNLTDEDQTTNVTVATNFYNESANYATTAASTSPSWRVIPRRPREVGAQITYSF